MRVMIVQMIRLQGWVKLNWMNEFVYLHLRWGTAHLNAELRGWWQASYWVGDKFQHDLHLFLLFRCLAFSHLFFFFSECTLTLTHTQSHRFKSTKWCADDSLKLGCRYSRIDDSSLTPSWSSHRERCHNKPALSRCNEARRSCKHTLLCAHTSTRNLTHHAVTSHYHNRKAHHRQIRSTNANFTEWSAESCFSFLYFIKHTFLALHLFCAVAI